MHAINKLSDLARDGPRKGGRRFAQEGGEGAAGGCEGVRNGKAGR